MKKRARGWLAYIGDDFTTQLYRDCFIINHEIRNPIEQPVIIMESRKFFFFVAQKEMGLG